MRRQVTLFFVMCSIRVDLLHHRLHHAACGVCMCHAAKCGPDVHADESCHVEALYMPATRCVHKSGVGVGPSPSFFLSVPSLPMLLGVMIKVLQGSLARHGIV